MGFQGLDSKGMVEMMDDWVMKVDNKIHNQCQMKKK